MYLKCQRVVASIHDTLFYTCVRAFHVKLLVQIHLCAGKKGDTCPRNEAAFAGREADYRPLLGILPRSKIRPPKL